MKRLCPSRNVCKLHTFAKNRVEGRGVLPCDILILGEAPGRTEDITGLPFTGASGRILNKTLERIENEWHLETRIFISNVVQCRPTDCKNGPNRAPTDEEVLLCRSNLEYIYLKARPKVIVCLGKTAEKIGRKTFAHIKTLQHPVFLLRTGGFESPYYIGFLREWTKILQEVARDD